MAQRDSDFDLVVAVVAHVVTYCFRDAFLMFETIASFCQKECRKEHNTKTQKQDSFLQDVLIFIQKRHDIIDMILFQSNFRVVSSLKAGRLELCSDLDGAGALRLGEGTQGPDTKISREISGFLIQFEAAPGSMSTSRAYWL